MFSIGKGFVPHLCKNKEVKPDTLGLQWWRQIYINKPVCNIQWKMSAVLYKTYNYLGYIKDYPSNTNIKLRQQEEFSKIS